MSDATLIELVKALIVAIVVIAGLLFIGSGISSFWDSVDDARYWSGIVKRFKAIDWTGIAISFFLLLTGALALLVAYVTMTVISVPG